MGQEGCKDTGKALNVGYKVFLWRLIGWEIRCIRIKQKDAVFISYVLIKRLRWKV